MTFIVLTKHVLKVKVSRLGNIWVH